jgi:chitin disaccharide deacetylase
MAEAARKLVVTADDFGIGPATSAGILDVAERGAVTAAVLLVNSPHAQEAVTAWRRRGQPMELGWHPNLTLDEPVLPRCLVSTLVDSTGHLLPLRQFAQRWLRGGFRREEIERELAAQLDRFYDLVGQWPTSVNTHQHVGVFAPMGELVLRVLQQRCLRPFLRRVREPWRLIRAVPGARIKRTWLTWQGRRWARLQDQLGFPGNDWLLGITDPKWVKDPDFHRHWLLAAPGRIVELMCHPGRLDPTVLGRDCHRGDGLMERRVDELKLLLRPDFLTAVADAGFTLVAPSQLVSEERRHARVA